MVFSLLITEAVEENLFAHARYVTSIIYRPTIVVCPEAVATAVQSTGVFLDLVLAALTGPP